MSSSNPPPCRWKSLPPTRDNLSDIAVRAGRRQHRRCDDTRLRYTATSSSRTIATVRMIDTEVLIDPLTSGTTTITVTAIDPWGATASTTFNANIQTPALSAPTRSISGNVFSFGFTDDFAANETRFYEVRIRHKSPIGPWATACFSTTNTEDFSRNIAASLDIRDCRSDDHRNAFLRYRPCLRRQHLLELPVGDRKRRPALGADHHPRRPQPPLVR